jgi:dTMP kinase
MEPSGRPGPALIVLLGIDGAGKSTAAKAVQELLPGIPVLVLGNYSGRKTLVALAQRCGMPLPAHLADAVETVVRVFNVLLNHLRAARFDGVVIMDRHLYCQLALRKARGIRRRRAVEAVLRLLPAAHAVVYFDITAEQAHERIMVRGEDQETLVDLQRFLAAYTELPCYPGFSVVDAGGTTASSAMQLKQIIDGVTAPSEPLPQER